VIEGTGSIDRSRPDEFDVANDPFTLHTPPWLNRLVAIAAEVVLLLATVGIITAMWLPAYLTSRQKTEPGERGHEEMVGMFPRGR
jgi:hypothetical protein